MGGPGSGRRPSGIRAARVSLKKGPVKLWKAQNPLIPHPAKSAVKNKSQRIGIKLQRSIRRG